MYLKKISLLRENIKSFDHYPFSISASFQTIGLFRILHDLTRNGTAQFIIATHSPILLGYPNSVILNFDDRKINEIEYEMTDHYQITKYFLQHREKVISEILD
jgi:predicted ATPase